MYAFRADGTLVPGFPRPTANAAPIGDAEIAIADLEGDGQVELVRVDSGAVQVPSRLFVWTIPGAGTPAPHAWPMLRRDPGHSAALP